MTRDDPSVTPGALRPPDDPGGELREPLTPREGEVADLLWQMAGYKQMGAILGCAERTVEAHVVAIGRKLRETDDKLGPAERALRWAICRAFWRGDLNRRKAG
jgi:DNA-binding NarL/FixJ family response regulator